MDWRGMKWYVHSQEIVYMGQFRPKTTTIFYLESVQSRVSNFDARVSKLTSWAQSSSFAAKVVSARFHKIHCAQDSAQDFAQVNYTYLSAKRWIHIDTMMLNPASRSTLHPGCKYNVKAIVLRKAMKSMTVPAEIDNLPLKGFYNHDSLGRKQQSSPRQSRQSQQKSTI